MRIHRRPLSTLLSMAFLALFAASANADKDVKEDMYMQGLQGKMGESVPHEHSADDAYLQGTALYGGHSHGKAGLHFHRDLMHGSGGSPEHLHGPVGVSHREAHDG